MGGGVVPATPEWAKCRFGYTLQLSRILFKKYVFLICKMTHDSYYKPGWRDLKSSLYIEFSSKMG
jgi:hypothetical protein